MRNPEKSPRGVRSALRPGHARFLTTRLAPLLLASPVVASPFLYPGPAGVDGKWGVRVYLNQGINSAEDLGSVLAFLTDPNTAATRTPALSPGTVVDSQEQVINFTDPEAPGPAGVVGGAKAFPGNTGADDEHFIIVAHSLIQITEESDYTFNNHSDDGFLLRVLAINGPDPVFSSVSGNGSMNGNSIQFDAGTSDADTRGVIHLKAGIYRLEYVMWEGGGGFACQLTAAKGAFPNNADTATWRAVGYVPPQPAPVAQPAVTSPWTVQTSAPGSLKSNNLAGVDAAVNAALAADPVAATSTAASINFADPDTSGATGRVPGEIPFPRNNAGVDDDYFGLRASTTLHIAEEGDYLFGFAGDDGGRLTIGNAHQWRAYNDSAWKSGQTNAANTTLYGLGRNFTGTGPSGLLKNSATGADTPITATYTEFMTTGSVNSAGDPATYTAGTDAAATFGGFADIAGNMSYGDAPGWYVDLTFTGLDPAKHYTFAATANRSGGASYASRVTNWSLRDTLSATPASTTGAVRVSATSVEFSTGENGAGLVARWTDITPTANGSFTIRTTHGVGAAAGGIADADAFRGYAGGVFLLAEQSDFTALTENATGAGSIGRPLTYAANSGSLGAAADFGTASSAQYQRPGALAGSTDTAITTTAADALKTQVPFTAAFNTTSFTVEAWVKPDVVNGAGVLTCVLANGHFADPRSGWLIYQGDTGWVFRTYNQNGLNTVVNITAGPAPVAGTWYYLTASWDGVTGTARLSVDGGVPVLSAPGQPFVANVDGPFTIGARSDAAFGWAGSIDEVAYYGTVVDDVTLASHRANGLNAARAIPYPTLIKASNPLGYWRLNEVPLGKGDFAGLYADVPTGDSTTVGRIHLPAGDYPLNVAYFEVNGGSWFEVFGRRESGSLPIPFVPLTTGTAPYVDLAGLTLAQPIAPVFTGSSISGDNVTLTLSATPGLNYIIETSTDLVTWTQRDILFTGPGATTAWTKSLTTLGLTGAQRVFWRARME